MGRVYGRIKIESRTKYYNVICKVNICKKKKKRTVLFDNDLESVSSVLITENQLPIMFSSCGKALIV